MVALHQKRDARPPWQLEARKRGNRINHPYQMAASERKKKSTERNPRTQKDVKLENPRKPEPGCQRTKTEADDDEEEEFNSSEP